MTNVNPYGIKTLNGLQNSTSQFTGSFQAKCDALSFILPVYVLFLLKAKQYRKINIQKLSTNTVHENKHAKTKFVFSFCCSEISCNVK